MSDDDYDYGTYYYNEVAEKAGRELTDADRELIRLTANFVSRDLY